MALDGLGHASSMYVLTCCDSSVASCQAALWLGEDHHLTAKQSWGQQSGNSPMVHPGDQNARLKLRRQNWSGAHPGYLSPLQAIGYRCKQRCCQLAIWELYTLAFYRSHIRVRVYAHTYWQIHTNTVYTNIVKYLPTLLVWQNQSSDPQVTPRLAGGRDPTTEAIELESRRILENLRHVSRMYWHQCHLAMIPGHLWVNIYARKNWAPKVYISFI